jgi:hypothetical protein
MEIRELAIIAKRELEELTGFTSPNVIGIGKREDLWYITIEIIEKKSEAVNLEVLGIYEVRLDTSGGFIGYERTMMRKRGDILR